MTEHEVRSKVDAIGRRLYEEYGAQKVILFGSRSSGTPNEDSDIDLFIIKETEDRPIDRLVAVRRLVRDLRRGVPFSPIVLTPAEVRDRMQKGDLFVREILEKGHVLS